MGIQGLGRQITHQAAQTLGQKAIHPAATQAAESVASMVGDSVAVKARAGFDAKLFDRLLRSDPKLEHLFTNPHPGNPRITEGVFKVSARASWDKTLEIDHSKMSPGAYKAHLQAFQKTGDFWFGEELAVKHAITATKATPTSQELDQAAKAFAHREHQGKLAGALNGLTMLPLLPFSLLADAVRRLTGR